ncbi:thioredoxin [Rhizobium ruizarguesonis]|uniref:thioredoxin n=2 Tax=Rhizobium ruizarguesonis TaxID=2081791 RepID=UPI000477E7C8|nr:thioredoxin [Rhizobium ruizarguesonis]NEH75059.1 DsbA family protein [Rhizobium ruizarguesonis]NEI76086.1 DsbA family protein [Rhizobium ruizarguesonis]WSH61102.1 DsbA family protein [Rhizobium ruizarguesonis]
MELVLAADPMCSWCYGLGKELTLLEERRPDITLKIIRLRAGATDVLDDAGKQFRLYHWERVEEASGLAFNREGLLARTGFVYDTEPICRAVVTARILRPQVDILSVFRAFQHAFYVDALDTTKGAVLVEVGSRALEAVGRPMSAEEFLQIWKLRSTIEEAAADFATARAIGGTSFPALFLRKESRLQLVSPGYAKVDELEARLKAAA